MELRLFVRDEAVENSENAFSVLIYAIEVGSEGALEILSLDPLVSDTTGDVDVLTQSIQGVSTQKEAVEECRLALRGQRIGVVS